MLFTECRRIIKCKQEISVTYTETGSDLPLVICQILCYVSGYKFMGMHNELLQLNDLEPINGVCYVMITRAIV